MQEHAVRLHTVGEHTQSACYVNAHFGYILGHMLWECILGVHAVGTHTRGSRCRTTYLGCVPSEDTIGVHSWAFCCRGLGGSGPRGSGQQRGCCGEAGRGGANMGAPPRKQGWWRRNQEGLPSRALEPAALVKPLARQAGGLGSSRIYLLRKDKCGSGEALVASPSGISPSCLSAA